MRQRKPTTYVALGSSFAAGPGLEPMSEPVAGRSRVNYPRLVAERLDLSLTDVTAAGATIDDLMSTEQTLFDGSRAAPQLAALSMDVDLVTVTVGGNDVQYLLSMWRRSAQVDPSDVPDTMRSTLAASVERDLIAAEMARLPGRLVDLLRAVGARAPNARRVVVDYLTVVGDTDTPGGWTPMTAADLASCREIGEQLEVATASAADHAGVELLSAAALSRDHGAGGAEPWVTGWRFGDVRAGGTLPYHPNAAGMSAVANMVSSALA